MMKQGLLIVLIALFLVTSDIGLAADYTFTTLDVPFPDVQGTTAVAINARGQIVGVYVEFNGTQHGFLYDAGEFTTIDFPGAPDSQATGINAQGQIVGFYDDGVTAHGFRYQRGEFRTIDFPDALVTFPRGINARGQIVGSYKDAKGVHGFILEHGKFTSFDAPDAFDETGFSGINDHGQIVGTFNDANGAFHAFIYEDGVFTPIFDTAPGAFPLDINNRGQIVVIVQPSDGGFSHSFVSYQGVFTPIDVPGAITTTTYGINDRGQIVGGYTTGVLPTHGFVASPIKAAPTPSPSAERDHSSDD